MKILVVVTYVSVYEWSLEKEKKNDFSGNVNVDKRVLETNVKRWTNRNR